MVCTGLAWYVRRDCQKHFAILLGNSQAKHDRKFSKPKLLKLYLQGFRTKLTLETLQVTLNHYFD